VPFNECFDSRRIKLNQFGVQNSGIRTDRNLVWSGIDSMNRVFEWVRYHPAGVGHLFNIAIEAIEEIPILMLVHETYPEAVPKQAAYESENCQSADDVKNNFPETFSDCVQFDLRFKWFIKLFIKMLNIQKLPLSNLINLSCIYIFVNTRVLKKEAF